MTAPTWAQPNDCLPYVPRTFTPDEVETAYRTGRITDEALWQWSNSWDVAPATVLHVFKHLGLRPWCGFPLVKVV